MTDKVQKIREEVDKIARSINPYIPDEEGKNSDYESGRMAMAMEILQYVVRLQEESVSDKFAFKAIPRLLEMIEPTDRAKAYIAKLADTLEVEGYPTDAKIVRESLKIMNGEKVAMATMDEEPVSDDLDEAANNFIAPYHEVSECGENWNIHPKEAFKAGANWQKQQMMKDAIELPLYLDGDFLTVDYDFTESGYKVGDKVKMIIIKEE